MSDTYEHRINLVLKKNIRIGEYSGPLSCVNDIIREEASHLENMFDFIGNQIVDELALFSQQVQRDTITRLGAVRTGRLRDSVRISRNGLSARVGTDLYYARYVHDGYGPRTQRYKSSHGGINVRRIGGASPRPWVDISASEFERGMDSIIERGIGMVF